MKKFIKKHRLIFSILLIILIIVIFGISIYAFDDYKELEKIKEEEAEYGDNYNKLILAGYEEKPDRILYKDKQKDGFYIFESYEENFAHLLEVAEDRMSYSQTEDFNLTAFKNDDLVKILSSGNNYVMFDYNNYDGQYNEYFSYKDKKFDPITYKLKDSNRLKRLLNYLIKHKKMYNIDNTKEIRLENKLDYVLDEYKTENNKTDDENTYKIKILTIDYLNKVVKDLKLDINKSDFKDMKRLIHKDGSIIITLSKYSVKDVTWTLHDISYLYNSTINEEYEVSIFLADKPINTNAIIYKFKNNK